MQPIQNISPSQAACLVFMSVTGLSMYRVTTAGRAEWVAIITGIILLLPLAYWLLYLSSLYPGKTILEIIEITTGRFVSCVVNIIYVAITIVMAVCVLNFFIQLIRVYFLLNTPTWAITLVITTVCVLMAKSGIEVLGRLFVITVALTLIIYFPVSGLGISEANIENIIPIFTVPPFQFIKGVYLEAGMFSESLIALMVITAALPQPDKYYKSVTVGFIILALSYGLSHLLAIAVLGAEQLSTLKHGGISAAQMIQLGNFIHGMEIFILIPYQLALFSKVPIYFYSSWTAVNQVFNNRYPQVFLWGLFAVITGLVILINSYNIAFFIAVLLARYILLPFVLLVLSIASIGCLIKRIKRSLSVKEATYN